MGWFNTDHRILRTGMYRIWMYGYRSSSYKWSDLEQQKEFHMEHLITLPFMYFLGIKAFKDVSWKTLQDHLPVYREP